MLSIGLAFRPACTRAPVCTAEELVEAFRIWRTHPDGTLDNVLASRGNLSTDRVRLLEELVGRCIAVLKELGRYARGL